MNRLPLVACLAALLAGCWSTQPELYPLDAPPNVVPGQVLLTVPQDIVAAMADPATTALRENGLAEVAENIRLLSSPGAQTAILAHQVTTGMTVEEVVWSVGSQPTGVRDQGPPGGHTLLWEPPGLLADRRFWVRFDEWGKVTAAGSQ